MDSLILQSIKQRWEEGQQKVALLLSSALNSLDVNVEDGWLLGKAAKSGYAEVVRMLLNNPQTEPSLSGNYAVRISAEKGHYQIVKMLLANPKVDPSAEHSLCCRLRAIVNATWAMRRISDSLYFMVSKPSRSPVSVLRWPRGWPK